MHKILILAVALLVSGCASSERISLFAQDGQLSRIDDGVPTLVSKKRHVVMLKPSSHLVDGGARPHFVVAVYNGKKQPALLSASAIRGEYRSKSGAAPLRVYKYEELVSEEKTRQRWATVAAVVQGVSASMAAANAGYTRSYGAVNANVYASNGVSANANGSFVATSYDSGRAFAAQQAVQSNSAANFAAIEAQGERNMRYLGNEILKDNTVEPNAWVGGQIVVDRPARSEDGSKTYSIVVPFDGEEHVFNISQDPTT